MNLKQVLMELGNDLVSRGFIPGYVRIRPSVARDAARHNTLDVLKAFTEWLNAVPEAQEILKAKGIEWPVAPGQTRRDPVEQWTTVCPACEKADCLVVIEATLTRTGDRIYPGSRLHPDGFEVDPQGRFSGLKDLSTEDEKVHCTGCGARFFLSDLIRSAGSGLS